MFRNCCCRELCDLVLEEHSVRGRVSSTQSAVDLEQPGARLLRVLQSSDTGLHVRYRPVADRPEAARCQGLQEDSQDA